MYELGSASVQQGIVNGGLSEDKPVNQEISAVITKDGTGSSRCKRLLLQIDQKE